MLLSKSEGGNGTDRSAAVSNCGSTATATTTASARAKIVKAAKDRKPSQ